MNKLSRSSFNRLRKHRRLMGYTQSDVAYLLDIKNKTVISRWEKGITIPLTDNVIRLAYVYHTFTEELFRDFYKKVRIEIAPREEKLIKLRTKKHENKKQEG